MNGSVPKQRTGRWRLRNWRLRTKVLAVLLIPTLTAIVLAGLRGYTELQRQQDLQLTATQVDVSAEISTVVNRLQRERFLAVAAAADAEQSGAAPQLQRQIVQVNDAVQRLRSAATTLENEDQAVRDRYDQGLQRLDSLAAIRSAVNGTRFPAFAAYETYSSIISDLIQLGRQVNAAVSDRELLRSADVLQSLSEAKDYASRLDAVLEIATTTERRLANDLLDEARAAQASFDASQVGFEANATPEVRQLYSDIVSGPQVDGRARLVEIAFNEADADTQLSIDADQLAAQGQATTDRLRQVQTDLVEQVGDDATALANEAQQAALRDAAIVLAALILSLLLVVLVVRSLLRPLRTLRSSALDIAYKRLPEEVDQILADPNPLEASRNVVQPVPVFSKEETGEVARSFDEVHARAVELAANQALLRESVNAMFINLSRRSQALVERQLSLIDQLEADEQDPDQLSSLFELDHLATRMRRNSENLLILGGTDLGRRLNKGVALSDVIGAAVSEIEQYTRVAVTKAPEYVVAGSVVNDLVHLIAELLDNATMYSNPESQVTVRSARVKTGAIGIEVTDCGVGISDTDLELLNQRLADPPELDVSVSRRMGLYVVAQLAKRHGIRVQLRENQDLDGGVIAKVIVPQELVQRGDNRSLTDTGFPLSPVPGTAEQTAASGTGTFAAVPDGTHEGTSPAMAAAGLARAFEFGARPGEQDRQPPGTNGNGQSAPGIWEGASSNGGSANGFPQPETTRNGSGQDAAEPYRAAQDDAAPFDVTQYDAAQQPNGQYHGEPASEAQQAQLAGGRDPAEKADEMDVPTDRLPIYEAVLSQWFSSEPEPAGGWDQQTNGNGNAAPGNGLAAHPERAETSTWDETPEGSATQQAVQDAEPADLPGLPKRVPGSNSAPERPPRPEPVAAEQQWSSPADEGWQAAANVLSQPVEQVTAAGLPKRKPKAHLVPGAAPARPAEPALVTSNGGSAQATAESASTGQAPTLTAVTVPRSAEAVRGRMSSLQRGVRRGRHAKVESHQQDESATIESESGEHEEHE